MNSAVSGVAHKASAREIPLSLTRPRTVTTNESSPTSAGPSNIEAPNLPVGMGRTASRDGSSPLTEHTWRTKWSLGSSRTRTTSPSSANHSPCAAQDRMSTLRCIHGSESFKIKSFGVCTGFSSDSGRIVLEHRVPDRVEREAVEPAPEEPPVPVPHRDDLEALALEHGP